MEIETKPAQLIVLEADGIESSVEDYDDVPVVAIIASVVIQSHHDEAGNLRGSGIQEMQIVLHLGQGSHVEECGAPANAQEHLECFGGGGDVFGRWRESGIGQ